MSAPYLPISAPYLPISPYISLYLPIQRRTCCARASIARCRARPRRCGLGLFGLAFGLGFGFGFGFGFGLGFGFGCGLGFGLELGFGLG